MKSKHNEATSQRPQGGRMINAPLVAIDLHSFTRQLKKEKQWKENDRNAITVFKTNSMSIVLIALRKDAEMSKHKAEGMITVNVLEGQMIFSTDGQSVELGKGQMLALHKSIPHAVLAKEKTVFLLTVMNTLLAETVE